MFDGICFDVIGLIQPQYRKYWKEEKNGKQNKLLGRTQLFRIIFSHYGYETNIGA